MPLDSYKPGISRHFQSFDQAVRGQRAGCKAFCQVPDGLMVHAVDLKRRAAANLGETAFGGEADCVGGDVKAAGLAVSNWKKLPIFLLILILSRNILVNISPESHVDDLNSPADAQNRLSRLHDRG